MIKDRWNYWKQYENLEMICHDLQFSSNIFYLINCRLLYLISRVQKFSYNSALKLLHCILKYFIFY